MDSAILRINDEPPKEWNLFREGKKTNALILQVNDRLLLIEIHEQQVRELDATAVKRNEDSITTVAKNPPGKTIGHHRIHRARHRRRHRESTSN